MKAVADAQVLKHLDFQQRGVFSKGDLQTAFGEIHPAAFARRVNALLKHGVLRRFCRGWYVSEEFNLATLSQRLEPESYISFGTVLARELIIGPNPENKIVSVKTGRSRRYAFENFVIEHVSVAPDLFFGFSTIDGVRYADAEKAFIDTLYFHLRARRYPFDIYSEMATHRLDRAKVDEYLTRYRNRKFITFVQGVLAA